MSLTRKNMHRIALTALTTFIISGCSWFGFNDETEQKEKRPTLADIAEYTEPSILSRSAIETPTLQDLINDYQALLALNLDENTKREIAYRLADLQMLASEETQLAETEVNIDQPPFDQSIEGYLLLLEQFPDNPANEHLLYQLAKAYDLSGQLADSILTLEKVLAQFPNTQYLAEIQFRRGEFYYAKKKYAIADLAYQDTIAQGESTKYYLNALFMRGWTQFKLNNNLASHELFIQLLDWHKEKLGSLEQLDRPQQSLVNDSLRLMSLMFSYSDNQQPIKSLLARVGQRDYEPMLYQHFADLLLSQDRYTEASMQLRLFIKDHPEHPWNFKAHQQLIAILIKAKLPKQVLAEKRQFVELYGVKTNYWSRLSDDIQVSLRPILTDMLNELSGYFHGVAQQYEQRKSELSLSKTEYLQAAAGYYRDYIVTAIDADDIAQKHYLLGEVEFDLGLFERAIQSYETAGYNYVSFENRVDAAYASVISREKHYALVQSPEHAQHLNKDLVYQDKINAQIRFSSTYPNSQYAPLLHQKSIEEVFNLEDYQRSLDFIASYRQQFSAQASGVKSQHKLASIEAHSLFFLNQYDRAEGAYISLLKNYKNTPSEVKDINERLAASIYKQAEQQVAAQQWQLAINTFLRVAQVVPSASIRATADFDAGHYAFEQKLWGQAIEILSQFRQRFPKHQLADSIPAKLAIAYENNNQPLEAANEYLTISAKATDPELKRQSLYQAASMFEAQGETLKAIQYFRDYAHNYPEPFDTNIEVQYKMSQFYIDTKEPSKRRFWLKKIMDNDAKAGDKRTARSRYLAAFAATIFAEDQRVAFNKIKLTLPLKKSLARKKKAMQKAIKGLEKVNSYQIADFATEATFKIGQIYTQLGQDILQSARPKLDELALEQYEIILEEQAYPFEEYAINIHEANAKRAWSGIYDDWVKKSFTTLESMMPARYKKKELQSEAISYE